MPLTHSKVSSSSEQIAQWSCKLKIDDIPQEVINKIKLIFLDSLGLIYASRNEEYIIALKKSFTELGKSSIPGHHEKLNPFDAITLNGTAIHGEDFDDTFEGTPVHIGSVMVSSIITASE